MTSRLHKATIAITGAALTLAGTTIAVTDAATAAPVREAAPVATSAHALAAGAVAAKKAAKKKGWYPAGGPIFNIPRSSQQYKLEDKIRKAIDHAHKGSYIHMALYSFDRTSMADALIRAKDRGVHVQVLVNDNNYTHAQHMLHAALGGKRKHHWKRSFFRRCTQGCRTEGGFLHAKFLMFSHTGTAHDVVMLGSVNLTGNAVFNQFNDMWTIHDHPRVFSWFVDLFNQMRKDKFVKKQHPPHPTNENWPAAAHVNMQKYIRMRLKKASGDLLLQALSWPHHSSHNDPIIDILNQVKCNGANGGTGTHGHTIVRVNMHAWNEGRGEYLAKKFKSLRDQGCYVQILYGMAGAKVRRVFAHTHMMIHSDGYDTNYDGDIDLYSHQKVLMISGHYGKKRNYHLVVTGSSNYTGTDIYGDQILFLIPRKSAYLKYTHNFKAIWDRHSSGLGYVANSSSRIAARMAEAPVPRAAGPAWEND